MIKTIISKFSIFQMVNFLYSGHLLFSRWIISWIMSHLFVQLSEISSSNVFRVLEFLFSQIEERSYFGKDSIWRCLWRWRFVWFLTVFNITVRLTVYLGIFTAFESFSEQVTEQVSVLFLVKSIYEFEQSVIPKVFMLKIITWVTVWISWKLLTVILRLNLGAGFWLFRRSNLVSFRVILSACPISGPGRSNLVKCALNAWKGRCSSVNRLKIT